jgi:hypothetical protein
MAVQLVTGREPVLAEALAWLESRGIEPKEIRAISIDAEVGEPLVIKVTLLVHDPREVTPDAVEE